MSSSLGNFAGMQENPEVPPHSSQVLFLWGYFEYLAVSRWISGAADPTRRCGILHSPPLGKAVTPQVPGCKKNRNKPLFTSWRAALVFPQEREEEEKTPNKPQRARFLNQI